MAKVTIVVPVWNAGDLVEASAESLLAQTMRPGDLEIVFVDDGSTDDSLARLRRVEAAHDHVRVISIPNSGWPGKPRNVGTDAAAGEYVMYVDQDDVLDPEAIQRMYDLGSANGSDVVLGKVISNFRGVHHYLYREQRPRCTVYDSRMMGSQTPHKMLRRQFLVDAGIRYPEGKRRLEDQLFITKAYFAASAASIVADYVCYRYLKREDGRNAGSTRIDPASYYANLREVLDVIDRYTEPGEVRDGFYRRFLKTEMLGRLGGRKLRTAPDAQREALLSEIRALMEERFPLSVDAGLAVGTRVRAAVTRTGTVADLVALDARMRPLQPIVRLRGWRTTDGGTIELAVEAELALDGSRLVLEPAEDQGWLLPTGLAGAEVSADVRRLEPLPETMGDVVIRHRDTLDEWFVPPTLSPVVEPVAGGGRLVWRGTAVLDPDTLAGGAPLRPGLHDLFLRVDAFGINRTVRIGAPEHMHGLVGSVASAHALYVNKRGSLSLRSGLSEKQLRHQLSTVARVRQDRDRLRIDTTDGWSGDPRQVALTVGPKPWVLGVKRLDDHWATARDVLASVPRGTYPASVRFRGLRGSVALQERVAITPPPRAGSALRRVVRRVRRALRRRTG